MKFFERKNKNNIGEANQVVKDWIINHIIEETKWAKDKDFITSEDYKKIKKILERK